MARRLLVLFAREPGREAREKGFRCPEAADLFADFAAGWSKAARRAGALLAVAAPPEDLTAWKRRFAADTEQPIWLTQRGSTFGERLERTARQASNLGEHAVLAGGDVLPCAEALEDAFEALESGADAVLAPAPDGGVSLVGLGPAESDLLRAVLPRRRDVFETLRERLATRGIVPHLVLLSPDVDSPGDLSALLRAFPVSERFLRLARRALSRAASFVVHAATALRPLLLTTPSGLRGPPAPPA